MQRERLLLESAQFGVVLPTTTLQRAAEERAVAAWTPTRVADWLEDEVGLPEYRAAFLAQRVDGRGLLELGSLDADRDLQEVKSKFRTTLHFGLCDTDHPS